jgi:hypothetical protein
MVKIKNGGFASYDAMLAELGLADSPEAQQMYNETQAQADAKRHMEVKNNEIDEEKRRLRQEAAAAINIRDEALRRQRDAERELMNEKLKQKTIITPWPNRDYDEVAAYLLKQKLKQDIKEELEDEQKLKKQIKRALSPPKKRTTKPKQPRKESKTSKTKPRTKSKSKSSKKSKK